MENTQAPHWSVVSVQDTNVRDETGMSVPGKRINVVFVDGSHSMVEVPFKQGWSAHAEEAIKALADEHAQVMGLQGPPVTVPNRRPFVNRPQFG